jgi:hypothetical protein
MGCAGKFKGISMNQLKVMVCPQCVAEFVLRWEDYMHCDDKPVTLIIRDCPSGGIYDVCIRCPECDYEEEL